MGRKPKLIVLPHLYDAGGDLSKTWYVEYSCRDPRTGKMRRFRHSEGINQFETSKERRGKADVIIQAIKEKLASGWSPFQESKISYEDELLMQKYAERWGRERESIPTLRVYLSEFLQTKKETIIPHSFQTYRSKLRIFNEWAEHNGLDKVHVGDITQDHIWEFLVHIAKENNSSRRTVGKYRQILHGFFAYLLGLKLITVNPTDGLPSNLGRVTDEAARPIPDADRKKLLAYMHKHDPQLWLFCLIQYYCAIRPNELRQLRVGDIDLAPGVIRVPCTVSKNRKSESVNIPAQLSKVFSEMGLDVIDSSYYLFSYNGMPGLKTVGKNNFRFRFNRIRNLLGLPVCYKLYSFKYTGAVELVNAGIGTWELQRHLRHRSVETTEHYIRRNFVIKSDVLVNRFPDI